MSITVKETAELVKKFGRTQTDTGSPEVQVAVFTHRILNLTEHMKRNHKDFHSRRGLLSLVGRRRSVLKYLKNKNEVSYRELTAKLGIRN